jgi:hypothetical protein
MIVTSSPVAEKRQALFRLGCNISPTAILVPGADGREFRLGTTDAAHYDECSFEKVSFLTT